MRLAWLAWFWPIIILFLSASVSLAIFVPAISSTSGAVLLRPPIVVVFLFICPGMALVPLFRLRETVIELMIGIALSFTIDSFVAGILLYAGRWSILHILILLLAFSLAGAVLQLILVSSPWLASSIRQKKHAQKGTSRKSILTMCHNIMRRLYMVGESKSGKPVSTTTPSAR